MGAMRRHGGGFATAMHGTRWLAIPGWLKGRASFAPIIVALPMVVLTLIPAGFWTAPVEDALYHGFDPNIVVTSGAVLVTNQSATLSPTPQSNAAITVATTLRARMIFSLDAAIDTDET